MNKKGMSAAGLVGVVFVLIIVGFSLYLVSKSLGGQNFPASTQNDQASPGKQAYTIEITSSGFSPGNLEINQGDSVTWINRGGEESWPASAMHPTHTIYPGSDIKKCGTSEESKIFDACKGLAKGENWAFTFNQVGEWNYHDHLSVGNYGKIIVK